MYQFFPWHIRIKQDWRKGAADCWRETQQGGLSQNWGTPKLLASHSTTCFELTNRGGPTRTSAAYIAVNGKPFVLWRNPTHPLISQLPDAPTVVQQALRWRKHQRRRRLPRQTLRPPRWGVFLDGMVSRAQRQAGQRVRKVTRGTEATRTTTKTRTKIRTRTRTTTTTATTRRISTVQVVHDSLVGTGCIFWSSGWTLLKMGAASRAPTQKISCTDVQLGTRASGYPDKSQHRPWHACRTKNTTLNENENYLT